MLELPAQLRRDLESGTDVVVPSAQRATALHLAFAAGQLERGRRAFRTAPIHPFSAWLTYRSGQAGQAPGTGTAPRRLGAAEEWLLWREALTLALHDIDIPADDRLVDPLRRAARMLHDWRIPQAVLRASGSRESLLLAAALQHFEQRMQELHAVPAHRLLEYLAQCVPHTAVAFAGFAEVTAARRVLIEEWAAHGLQPREHRCDFAPGTAAVAAAPDCATEMALAAQWCRNQLDADPRRRLLVVIPDLSARQAAVRRVFDEVLAPPALTGSEDAAYAIEGGQPLGSYAPVRHALNALRLLCMQLELPELSAWLRGAFWSAPAAPARALLESWLRRVLRPRVSAAQLLAGLAAAPPPLQDSARTVAAAVQAGAAALAPATAAALGIWSGRFEAALSILGLGPHGQAASGTRQLHARLQELLRECAQTPAVAGELGAEEALAVLSRLIERTQFEPATGDVAVTLSAAAADPVVRYDGIWVAGLTASAFPQPARLDPFIPPQAQRLAGIGAAGSAGVIRQARGLLRAWQHCAGELVVSWPQQSEDRACLPSPLLQELTGATPWHACPPHAGLARSVRASRRVEEFTDEHGAAWNPARPLPAGARAIELQSRCAFRAHAELQLGAVPLETPQPGITPSERGRMLHRGLELLWRQLGDQAALRSAQDGLRLEALIDECARRAAQEVLGAAAPAQDAGGIGALRNAAVVRERARAARLMHALCELELRRPPFQVQALEVPRRLQLGDALLDLRIDRIDELADGTHVIFDYKTGQPLAPDWLSSRSTQPQLPLYLLAAAVPVSALAMVYLTPRTIAYKGIADQAGRLPGLTGLAQQDPAGVAWRQHSERWQQQLLQLAQDFVAGRAATDPAADACRHCHLHAFCRIGDLEPQDEIAAEDE